MQSIKARADVDGNKTANNSPVYESFLRFEQLKKNIRAAAQSTTTAQTPNHDLRFLGFILFEDGCGLQTFIISQNKPTFVIDGKTQ